MTQETHSRPLARETNTQPLARRNKSHPVTRETQSDSQPLKNDPLQTCCSLILTAKIIKWTPQDRTRQVRTELDRSGQS